jgi:hypothetical protein
MEVSPCLHHFQHNFKLHKKIHCQVQKFCGIANFDYGMLCDFVFKVADKWSIYKLARPGWLPVREGITVVCYLATSIETEAENCIGVTK